MVPEIYRHIDIQFFYDTIANLNIRNNTNTYNSNLQKGGGNFNAKYEEHTFDMSVEKYKDYTHIAVHSKTKDRDCVSVYIFKGNNIASLNNMSYYSDCAVEGLKRPGGGKILLNFIIDYLKQNKKKYKINKLSLKDNSFLPCNSCNSGLPLARLKMVTKNSTWYMDKGFTLCNSKGEPYEETEKLLAKNKDSLRKILTKDVDFGKISNTMQKAESKYVFDPYEFKRLYKKYTMILDLINRLAKESDKYCCLVSYILAELFSPVNRDRYGLFDFYQMTYCLDL